MQQNPQSLQSVPSFSVHSVADSSGPAISEVEEIHEVHKLLRTGEHAFKSRSFQHALRCYNEALEIDDLSLESYAGRAAVYIELGNYILAQRDAEKVITMEPDNTQGHYLLGIALHNLGYFRESLLSFLKALDLDSDNDHVEVLTNNIATIASQICDIPDKLLANIPDMDPYKKLTEVGCCLYSGKKYDTCIRVLNAAQKLETNQKGITMKVQLTQANAHAALKHNELAISLYQDCLQTALSAHDESYQTKALVSTASLFLELGDTHSAIVHYQKLLDLQRELQGEDLNAPLPDYWSMDLQCALHLNLSIAYKTIGSMRKAVQHAEIYCTLIEGYDPESRKNAQAQSHQNVGMLHELLGNYKDALDHYTKYLKMSKSRGNKVGVAQAYGCLGSVYGHLRNQQLAVSYHEQHVNMAKTLQNEKMLCTACELQGDTLMLLDNYEGAVDSYTEMVKSCHHNDMKGQTTALCKLGTAYRRLGRREYSIYYFEQAKQIAEQYKYTTIRIMCQFHMACLLQTSTQMDDLERSRSYFGKLIPVFEGKLQQHAEEDSFCPQELRAQLQECYDGIQNVLAKIGYGDECLQYSEAQKKKKVVELLQMQHVSGMKFSVNNLALFDAWTVDRMSRVVSQQNAAVLYYQILPSQILIWVLKPGEGVVRFYAGKSQLSSAEEYPGILLKMIGEVKNRRDVKGLAYECENRALSFKDADLERQRNKNQKLSGENKENEDANVSKQSTHLSKQASRLTTTKSVERRLFDILVAPVDDILSKLEEDSPLIIIPDKVLCECPFTKLTDWNGKTLESRLRITYCPSLFTMDRVIQNELNHLKLQDDLEFERTQARLGGIAKSMQNIDFMRIAVGSPDVLCQPGLGKGSSRVKFSGGRGVESRSSTGDTIDLKRISNPRLLTSGKLATRLDSVGMSRDSTMLSMKSKGSLASIKEAPSTPRSRKGQPMVKPSLTGSSKPQTTKSMATVDKLLGAHTLSTLTTRTSTNTDITQSHQIITDYKQIFDRDKCVVIGAPKLDESMLLYGKEWRPPGDMLAAQSECYKVAEYCDVMPILGKDATKERFLKEVQSAAVIHIATIGCLKENLLVFSPNPSRHEKGLATMHSFVVSAEDIVELKLVARLVVLSCGLGPYDSKYTNEGFVLSSAFLTAGAQCVLTTKWSAPNKVLDKFYFHFYSSLQKGAYVSKAVAMASEELKKDERYADTCYGSSPIVIGKDVYLSIKFIRHAQLDQTLDKMEAQVEEESNVKPPLNPRPLIPNLCSREDNLDVLQECIASLLANHDRQPDVIPLLTALVDDGIKRLHVSDINHRTVTLPTCLPESEGAIRLVKFLGFHFQPQGEHFSEPYVIFPHWNHDDLLIPAFESLRALSEISEYPAVGRALHELLPATQEQISYLVDMFCITKHAPEIQLKVTDLSVKPLWKARKVQKLLYTLGYHQIGTLLYFNNVPSSRRLLMSSLQLLVGVSSHKSATLLHKLDVNLLGGPASHKGSSTSLENIRLPSLTPLILPRNQLRMSTPWVSTVERQEEMNEKIRLSRNASDLTSEYQFYVTKARTWHEASVAAQANEILEHTGRPDSQPLKVKVFPGSGQSQGRIPMTTKRSVTLPETDQKRDYAHFILKQRVGDIGLRHRNDVRKLYMPYVVNA